MYYRAQVSLDYSLPVVAVVGWCSFFKRFNCLSYVLILRQYPVSMMLHIFNGVAHGLRHIVVVAHLSCVVSYVAHEWDVSANVPRYVYRTLYLCIVVPLAEIRFCTVFADKPSIGRMERGISGL